MANDPYYVLRKASNGEYYFNLKGGNGETVATSERYTTKYSAERGIEAVRSAAPARRIVDLTK